LSVLALENVLEVEIGGQVCARTVDAGVYCWGDGIAGQLGYDASGSAAPMPVEGLPDVMDIAVAPGDSGALSADGTLFVWGGWDSVPRAFAAFEDADRLLGVSRSFGCVRSLDGVVRCWGFIDGFLSGDYQDLDFVPSPIEVPELFGAVAIFREGVSWTHFVLLDSGEVLAWGQNNFGMVGNGTLEDVNAPTKIGLDDVVQLGRGDFFACSLSIDGVVRCWGANPSGELGVGDNTHRTTPTVVEGLKDVRELAVGDKFACVLQGDGKIMCWGSVTGTNYPVPLAVGDYQP